MTNLFCLNMNEPKHEMHCKPQKKPVFRLKSICSLNFTISEFSFLLKHFKPISNERQFFFWYVNTCANSSVLWFFLRFYFKGSKLFESKQLPICSHKIVDSCVLFLFHQVWANFCQQIQLIYFRFCGFHSFAFEFFPRSNIFRLACAHSFGK